MKIYIADNILVKDRLCAEYDFISPYSATVVDKIINAGMRVIDNIDEADAVLTSHSALDAESHEIAGQARNDRKVRKIYIKPTYGTVSRFGLIAGASSMEQIGVCADKLDDAFAVLSTISGHDKNDGTSYPAEKYNYSADTINISDLKAVNEPDFKFKDVLLPVYKIISSAEISANIARFDGIKFGRRADNFKNINELIINSRSESFNLETKLNALMGAYVLSEGQFDKYYLKAAKIRRLIKQELEKIFEQADLLIFPAQCGKAAALADLTGCPAVIINEKILMAKEFDEDKLYAFGRTLK